VPKRQAQQLTVGAAADFDEFYSHRTVVLPLLPQTGQSMLAGGVKARESGEERETRSIPI